MAEAGISLGSNLGDKAATIERAVEALGHSPDIRLIRRSRLYRTEPWGDANQDWFLNACVLVETALSPQELLRRCLDIETTLGRDRSSGRRWGPRAIDLDLLFYDGITLSEPSLTLPHPHMFERAFVLVPLNEIAGDRSINGRSVAAGLQAIDRSGVTLWSGKPHET
jgi:2-amino-4-hydroxy-6-hydroxymethyldihydropteridine diphosphokinase